MSGGDRHPDLERFYEALLNDEDEDFYPDDEEEDDYDIYLDAEDMEDIIEDDDGELVIEDVEIEDDDEDEFEDDDEEDMNVDDEDEDDDEEDDEDGGQQWLNIQELLNAAGGSVQARSAILARLLAGGGGPAGGTRSGMRFRTLPSDPVERARVMAERKRRERWWEPQTEPHPRGLQLLRSGEFGVVGGWRGRRTRMLPPCRAEIRSKALVSYQVAP